MISKRQNQASVFVVDARPGDYESLIRAIGCDGIGVEVFRTGRAALRQDPNSPPELWVINMNLPDISGPDLLSMLRNRYPGVPIYLVSDDYRAEEEINARCSGAEMYLCKPLERAWLTSPMLLRQ